jgi:hypothetical protein
VDLYLQLTILWERQPCSQIVQTIENHSSAEMMLGGGAFGNRPICKLVGSYGLTLRALPPGTAPETYLRTQWLSDYHVRSILEYSVLKRANPHTAPQETAGSAKGDRRLFEGHLPQAVLPN